jgi:outer membrane lipoprotein SlyB
MDHFILDSAGQSSPNVVSRERSYGVSPGRARRRPVVLGATAGVLILGLVGAGAIRGLIPTADTRKTASQSARASDAAHQSNGAVARGAAACATCGTVEAVRPVEFEKKTVHRITVRMDDGSYRAISQPLAPGIGPGEKVRIVEGAVVAGR